MKFILKSIGLSDIILILILAIIPIIMILYNVGSISVSSSPVAAVYVDGELYGQYELSQDTSVSIGGTNTLQISHGEAFISQANCPDQICVQSPHLRADSPGYIVCLPNSIVVKIENADNSLEIDGYVS